MIIKTIGEETPCSVRGSRAIRPACRPRSTSRAMLRSWRCYETLQYRDAPAVCMGKSWPWRIDRLSRWRRPKAKVWRVATACDHDAQRVAISGRRRAVLRAGLIMSTSSAVYAARRDQLKDSAKAIIMENFAKTLREDRYDRSNTSLANMGDRRLPRRIVNRGSGAEEAGPRLRSAASDRIQRRTAAGRRIIRSASRSSNRRCRGSAIYRRHDADIKRNAAART